MIDVLTIYDWIDGRLDFNRAERRESIAAKDNMSASCSVGAMLELHELRSFLVRAQAGEAGTAETTEIGSVHEHAVPEGNAP